MPTDPVIPVSQFPPAVGGGTFPPSPTATPTTAPLAIPLPHVASITEQAVADTIAKTKSGYSNKLGVRASTADRGTIGVFENIQRGRLEITGYSTYRRTAGLEAGAEVTFDLHPKP